MERSLPKRVLVVDDEPDARDLLAYSLGSTYTVETASNGEEALALLLDQPFDAVLLDVMMPIMDGSTLIGRLREIGILVPIALTSAHPGVRDLARKHGVDALPKPVDLADVEGWLSAATGCPIRRALPA